MTLIERLIAAFWRGYLSAVESYALLNPPADIEQRMEDRGWNAAQTDLVAHDGNYVPQSRTIL